MYQLTDYGKGIVAKYGRQMPWIGTITIPFATISSASQKTSEIPTDECTDDVLILEMGVNFLNALVRLIITDNSQYQWMQNNVFAPIHTIAGAATQVMPILPIPIEYFLPKNNRLFFTFQNASASPETVDRFLTVRGIRLRDRQATK
jgi:hypothetical protein